MGGRKKVGQSNYFVRNYKNKTNMMGVEKVRGIHLFRKGL